MRFLFIFLLFIANNLHGQVGIGTTTPHSTLDVRGSLALSYRAFTSSTAAASTDNTLMFSGNSAATVTLPDATTCTGRMYTIKNVSAILPVPIVTIATTASQTIDGSISSLLDDALETITVISNGANWSILAWAAAKPRSNYVLVRTSSDLPAPVAGIVTLTAGVLYEINGTIVMTNKINLNGCYLIGMDANSDKIIYTPGSGELFTGTKGGTIKTLTLAAITNGSKLFNLSLGATENLIFRDNIVANCKDVGIIQGGYIVFFSVINYSGNLNGITYQNCANVLIDNAGWFPTNSNTFEKFVGAFDVIEKLGGFSQPLIGLSATALDVSGITSISEAANLKNVAIIGTGTRVVGTFSSKWEVEALGLQTEKDDVATGNIYITTKAPTYFTAVNVPAKVLGTTTVVGLFRVSAPGSNRLTYTGTKIKRFTVLAAISISALAPNNNFSFYIYKNGLMLPESEQIIRLTGTADRGAVTLSTSVQMATNDYIEIWAANLIDGSGVQAETLNFFIK